MTACPAASIKVGATSTASAMLLPASRFPAGATAGSCWGSTSATGYRPRRPTPSPQSCAEQSFDERDVAVLRQPLPSRTRHPVTGEAAQSDVAPQAKRLRRQPLHVRAPARSSATHPSTQDTTFRLTEQGMKLEGMSPEERRVRWLELGYEFAVMKWKGNTWTARRCPPDSRHESMPEVAARFDRTAKGGDGRESIEIAVLLDWTAGGRQSQKTEGPEVRQIRGKVRTRCGGSDFSSTGAGESQDRRLTDKDTEKPSATCVAGFSGVCGDSP
ncbi:hypothetical protein KIPE111705_03635 [Kibdelosporangium persicum]